MRAQTLAAVLANVEGKRPVVLATNLDSGEQRLLHRGDGDTETERADVGRALRVDTCLTTDGDSAPQIF